MRQQSIPTLGPCWRSDGGDPEDDAKNDDSNMLSQ